jgi:nucleoid-associated protein YgaU
MDCRQARHLLDQGVVPGASDAQNKILGFHLSGCAACRAYRKQADERRLLHVLMGQHPHAGISALPRRRVRQCGNQRMRVASAAFLVSSALAVVPSHSILPAVASEVRHTSVAALVAQRAAAAPAAAAPHDDAALLGALLAGPHDDAALLGTLLAGPVDTPRPASLQLESATARSERLAALRAQAAVAAPVAVEAAAIEAAFSAMELAPGTELVIPALEAPAGPADAAPADVAQQAAVQYYTVLPGDSLWSIAARLLGNPLRWQEIWRANGSFANPNLIYPNQVFVLPSNTPAAPAPAAPAAPAQPPRGAAGFHTVVRGDTLWAIAARVYGNPYRWTEIYQANKTKIADPHWIYPGQELSLPPR